MFEYLLLDNTDGSLKFNYLGLLDSFICKNIPNLGVPPPWDCSNDKNKQLFSLF